LIHASTFVRSEKRVDRRGQQHVTHRPDLPSVVCVRLSNSCWTILHSGLQGHRNRRISTQLKPRSASSGSRDGAYGSPSGGITRSGRMPATWWEANSRTFALSQFPHPAGLGRTRLVAWACSGSSGQ
jgi:hypothetical protein